MRKNSFGQGLAIFFVIIGVLFVIGSIGEASEPKCIKAGCDNKQASGSSYCYLHKLYTGSSTSHSSSSYSNKSSSSTSKSSKSNSGSGSSYNNKSNSTNKSSYSSGTKKSTYDSYDDGYDDIYMDGDYDYDRYDRDRDYVVENKADGAASFMVGTTEYAVPLGNMIDVEAEIARMEAELKHKEGFLQGVMKKLSNEKFVKSSFTPLRT